MYDLTQEDLAQKLGITRQTVLSIEKQKYDPSLELAFKISNLFKVKIEDIFSQRNTRIKQYRHGCLEIIVSVLALYCLYI